MAHDLIVDYAPVINGTALTQSHNVQGNQNLSLMEIAQSGSLENLEYLEAFSEPNLNVETFNIFDVLDSGVLNVSLTAGLDASAGNTIAQYKRAVDQGGFSSGTDHVQALSAKAFAFVESIRATQDENVPASLKLGIHLLRSGSTEPNVVSDAATLLGALSLGVSYAMGPVYIAGTKYDGLQQVEYVSGLQARVKRESGEMFGDSVRISKLKHEFRLGVEEFATLETQGFGLSDTAGAVDMYLRKINTAGGRVADATAEHLKLSFSAAKFLVQELKTSGDEGETQAVPTILNTGTVSLSLVSAIP
tara:strand:- start:4061 stop:4975 length:915 start_codon:yes stop_codon:yes gene_type:complete